MKRKEKLMTINFIQPSTPTAIVPTITNLLQEHILIQTMKKSIMNLSGALSREVISVSSSTAATSTWPIRYAVIVWIR